jgi:hypothetical protein
VSSPRENWDSGAERVRLVVMNADLRDTFAIHFAAALAREQRYSLEFIAGRAYDLAEALLAERDRRLQADLFAVDDAVSAAELAEAASARLLDEPMPPSNDDEQPLLDPSWFEEGAEGSPSRPGLARTRVEDRKKQRSA